MDDRCHEALELAHSFLSDTHFPGGLIDRRNRCGYHCLARHNATLLGPARPCRGADPVPPPPGVEAIVPVEPEEHERLHYFGRRHHHLVPGTVTIDRPPYVCDVDGRQFTQGDDFVAHLRAVHHARPAEIPELLLVRDGVVHFPGR